MDFFHIQEQMQKIKYFFRVLTCWFMLWNVNEVLNHLANVLYSV